MMIILRQDGEGLNQVEEVNTMQQTDHGTNRFSLHVYIRN